jgi:type I restriction enzyme S subunit
MSATKNTKAFYNTEIPSDWSIPEFGDVFNFLKTFSFSREQLTSEPTNDGIRNIHYGDIHATYENEILDFEIEKTVPYLLDGLIDSKYFDDEDFPALKEGDLIIADASEDYEGVCDCVELKNISGAKVVSGLHTFAARASEDDIALGYRTYALQHEQVIRELRRIATGTSVYGVSKNNLSKVRIPLPPLPEQKAIAQVLSTADAAIHTTEKLIAQKELRIKWLMQQLLSGKKRLKGFKGEWKEVRLKEVTTNFSRRNKDLVDAKVYSVTNKSGFVLQSDHFEGKVAGEDLSNYKIIKKYEFAYNPARVNVGSLAYFEEEIGVISSLYVCFKTTKDVLDYFLLQFLQIDHTKHRIEALGEGGVRVYLWYDLFSKIKIRIPSIEEQTAIAQVLQAADKEISLLKTKAKKLREQKKGLMQKLLTGRVRLKLND